MLQLVMRKSNPYRHFIDYPTLHSKKSKNPPKKNHWSESPRTVAQAWSVCVDSTATTRRTPSENLAVAMATAWSFDMLAENSLVPKMQDVDLTIFLLKESNSNSDLCNYFFQIIIFPKNCWITHVIIAYVGINFRKCIWTLNQTNLFWCFYGWKSSATEANTVCFDATRDFKGQPKNFTTNNFVWKHQNKKQKQKTENNSNNNNNSNSNSNSNSNAKNRSTLLWVGRIPGVVLRMTNRYLRIKLDHMKYISATWGWPPKTSVPC